MGSATLSDSQQQFVSSMREMLANKPVPVLVPLEGGCSGFRGLCFQLATSDLFDNIILCLIAVRQCEMFRTLLGTKDSRSSRKTIRKQNLRRRQEQSLKQKRMRMHLKRSKSRTEMLLLINEMLRQHNLSHQIHLTWSSNDLELEALTSWNMRFLL